ncbi:hypothetical protein [Paenibacillus harenae]|uniref:hypothetical protein n=1 Tax=Paenibacillus harenae TaxID=306543 RepID=UPI002792EDBC|nr:hypothetical protein [Paenibacillus harenae]MDQ0063565.1 hypothetical protein [Paenibacillus harenae]
MQTLPSGIKKLEATDNATVANLNANVDLLDAKITKLSGIEAGAGTANSATDTVIGNRTIDDTVVASAGADTPTRLWSKLANVIKGVMGTATWYTLPSMTITAIITALGLKAPLGSPSLTGTPTAPTAAADTSTQQLATTAYVVGQAGTTTPLVNGTAAVGTSPKFARQDHVHPTDTTRAPLASPALIGTPTAPTAAVGTNTTQIATSAFANAAVAAKITNKITVSTTAPTSPAVNDIWIDTSV